MNPWRTQCLTCGDISPYRLNALIRHPGRCGACRPRGFDRTAESFVYLVTHQELGAAKVGICRAGRGNTADRLSQHRKHGWRVASLEPVSGEKAPAIEKAILSQWRNEMKLPRFLDEADMPQGGWTETVELDAIDIPATIARIRVLATAGEAALPHVA